MAVEYRNMSTLSVLVPVYDEVRTVRTVLDRLLHTNPDFAIEVIAVDDGSSDGSSEVLRDYAHADARVRVVSHDVNRGKGAAIRTALDHATGDVCVVQDADLQYHPEDIPRLIGPIVDGRADAVYGSRFAASPERSVMPFRHSVRDRFITGLTNALNDLNLTDCMTGYKAVRTDVLRALRLKEEGFGIEAELTTRLAQWGARIFEVPVRYSGRNIDKGKKADWRVVGSSATALLRSRFFDTAFSHRDGHSTLESLRMAPSVNRWLLSQFEPVLGDEVLEAGAGIGNLTTLLIGRRKLVSLDVDPFYVEVLDRHYGHLDNFHVLVGNLEEPTTFAKMKDAPFDSVVCVNVLEHLDDPETAVRGFHAVVRPGGTVCLLVPAHQWLFSDADRAIEHRRRYTVDEVEELLEKAGLDVEIAHEFNRLGVLGWLVNKVMHRTRISRWQARIYGWLLPVAKLMERVSVLPGLSIVAVGRRIDPLDARLAEGDAYEADGAR